MAGKRKEMTPSQKDTVVAFYQDGFSQRKIAEILGISQSGVSKFLKRLNQRGGTENLHRSGWKRKTDIRGDRKLLRSVKADRRQTLAEITNNINNVLPNPISSRTVRRRLRFYGFTRRKVRKTLTISATNRTRRVNWCRAKLHWSVNSEWKKVIFSDETQVVVDQNRRVYVWRRADEIWRPECLGLRGSSKFSAMFWGCITHEGIGTFTEVDGIINSRKYIEILDSNLWPVLVCHFSTNDYLFQEDNAPVHTSNETKRWKTENGIKCLTWPSQSSDINVIENVWRTIKIKLQKEINDIKNRQDLVCKVKEIWASLPTHYIQSLYSSIPKRLRQVIRARGHATKY